VVIYQGEVPIIMKRLAIMLPITLLLAASLAMTTGCKRREAFNIRDVDPGQAGQVRSLGPESQDVRRLSDLMVRSLLDSRPIRNSAHPPTIAMLPMENNTRFAFNPEVFTTMLRGELNRQSDGQLFFVARNVMADIEAERAARREGTFDYDPERRTRSLAGADFFLVGRVDGMSTRSRQGDAEYAVYSFSLVDTETSLILWEDLFDVKREGRDDVVYR